MSAVYHIATFCARSNVILTMSMNEHSQRVMKAIEEGSDRPSEIARRTCLDSKKVSDSLRELRKMKLISFEDGKYKKASGE